MHDVRNWTVTNYKSDHIPAYVDTTGGRPNIVVNASDMTGMTRAEADALARQRNDDQVSDAEAVVKKLTADLEAAQRHLARVKSILKIHN